MDCHIHTNRTVWKGPVWGEHDRMATSNITPDDLPELLSRLLPLGVLRQEKPVSSNLGFREQHSRCLLRDWLGHKKITSCLARLLSSGCTYMLLTRLSVIRTQRHILADVWRCERGHLKQVLSDEEVYERGGVDQMKIKSLTQGDSQWGVENIRWEFFLLLRPDNSPLLSLQVICVKLHVLWVGNCGKFQIFIRKEALLKAFWIITFFVRRLRTARHLWTAFADLQERDRNNLFTLQVGE